MRCETGDYGDPDAPFHGGKPTAYPRSALNARVVAHIRENPAVLAVDAAVVDAERYGAGYSVPAYQKSGG